MLALAIDRACADPSCLMVSQNRGSGTRVLIDGLLAGRRPPGHAVEVRSHNAVAAAVSQNRADWGLAIEPVAQAYGLAFLPVRAEQYDFAIPADRWDRPAVASFRQICARNGDDAKASCNRHVAEIPGGTLVNAGGVILCGGESKRMGRSKATLPFGSECMLQRVVRLVATVADPIVVVTAPGQTLPRLPESVAVAEDAVRGRGPLQGLAAGLAAFPDHVELVYATATDVPFLKPAWISSLVALAPGNDLVIPYLDGYYHPLAAVYRRAPRWRQSRRCCGTIACVRFF